MHYIKRQLPSLKLTSMSQADPESLNMIQDMIVVGEVIARDHINAGVLLYLPVLETKAFAFV